MELALFTPRAYIWPVYRNFESFIAALGTPSTDACDAAASACYPAQEHTDSALCGLPESLDDRLGDLHRDLYDALLRPVEMFASDPRSIAECFWPDLDSTSTADLLSAFLFFFLQRDANDTPVVQGLNALRAVFFNHDSSNPELWLYDSLARLDAEQRELPLFETSFIAPADTKLSNLRFLIVSDLGRPAGGGGWVLGHARRKLDGTCHVELAHGLDPSLAAGRMSTNAADELSRNASDAARTVFGWQGVEA